MARGRSPLPAACRIVPILAALPPGGCGEGLFDPQGPVAAAERTIFYNSLGIMLAIVIPTMLTTLGVAWWYRASNRKARYQPDVQYSGRVEMVVWSIPAMTILLLGGICWIGSHDLDPFRPIPGTARPLRVQVVSMDWKWLFILPDQGIASVNRLMVPAGTPISLELTSAGVMNGFIVPQLGSQIATMPHMMTRLQLLADHPGTYGGRATQFSGDGFADMGFTVQAMPPDQFAQAVAAIRGHDPPLDPDSYRRLAEPYAVATPFSYGAVAPGMFQRILQPPAAPATAARPAPRKEMP